MIPALKRVSYRRLPMYSINNYLALQAETLANGDEISTVFECKVLSLTIGDANSVLPSLHVWQENTRARGDPLRRHLDLCPRSSITI